MPPLHFGQQSTNVDYFLIDLFKHKITYYISERIQAPKTYIMYVKPFKPTKQIVMRITNKVEKI